MSFIQKLIERKTQATGSVASEHAVEDDLAAQEADTRTRKDGLSVVSIVDLEDPDKTVTDDDPRAESYVSQPESAHNVLNLTDPFLLDEDDEIDDELSALPDLEIEGEAVSEVKADGDQKLETASNPDGDIDVDDEAFNIWDVDMDGEAEPEDEAAAEPEDEPEAAAEPEDKPEAAVEPEDEPEAAAEPEDEPEAAAEPEDEPEAAAEPEDEPEAAAEPEDEPEAAAEDEPEAAVEPEAPQENQVASTPAPDIPRIQTNAPVNQDSRPKTPEPTMEATPEITDIQPEEPAAFNDAPEPASPETEARSEPIAAPQAAKKRRVGRVKTRLLGFEHAGMPGVDMFDRSPPAAETAEAAAEKAAQPRFPVGWLVVVDGPGRGESFSLHAGMSQIGRGEDQAVQLDFGDATISRDNHAAIVYDVEEHAFFMGHGGKVNVVRLNSKPLICTEKVNNADLIRIGETTLRLVVLCNAEFNWEDQNSKGPDDVAIA